MSIQLACCGWNPNCFVQDHLGNALAFRIWAVCECQLVRSSNTAQPAYRPYRYGCTSMFTTLAAFGPARRFTSVTASPGLSGPFWAGHACISPIRDTRLDAGVWAKSQQDSQLDRTHSSYTPRPTTYTGMMNRQPLAALIGCSDSLAMGRVRQIAGIRHTHLPSDWKGAGAAVPLSERWHLASVHCSSPTDAPAGQPR
jgi:hypothetical protein